MPVVWISVCDMGTVHARDKYHEKTSERNGGQRRMKDECCGTCKYHRRDGSEWICNNEDSEMYACYTDYTDECGDYEERED